MTVASQAIVPKRVYTEGTPLLLQPLSWCGRQYKNLTYIEPAGYCGKICQIIKKIIPAILLALATVLAAIVGLGDYCVSPSSQFSSLALTDLKLTKDNFDEVKIKKMQEQFEQLFCTPFCTPSFNASRKIQVACGKGHFYDVYNFKANISRPPPPPRLNRLIEAFKGPFLFEASFDNIADFLFGNKMESNLKHQTEQFITNRFSSISLDLNNLCACPKSELKQVWII